MKCLRIFVAVGIALLGAGSTSSAQELAARTILARTAQVYAECKTYRDSGVATTVFVNDGKRRTVRKPFTTAFVRPGRFRYEFLERRCEDEFDRYLIWQDGEDVRTWWDVRPGVEEKTDLDSALGAARGVSGASSYTIPDLLLDLTTGFPRVTDLENAERQEDADLAGTRCFVLAGGATEAPVTLWIEHGTFLLRRIDERHTFDDFRTEETTTYRPELDVELEASALAFDPPVQRRTAATPAARRPFRAWSPEELESTEILARSAKVYAACRSYRDRGTVEEVSFDERREACTERSPFTTAFVRPDRFRYEIRRRRGEEEFDRCLAWRSGEDVRAWWDVKPGVVLGSPSSLLATATVASGFTAARVPALFLPELPEAHVTRLTDVQRMEDEELAGAICFVLQGRWPGGASITLWIDRRSFLLRQTLTEDFGRQTRTTYEPELDAEIPEAQLVFDPPLVETR